MDGTETVGPVTAAGDGLGVVASTAASRIGTAGRGHGGGGGNGTVGGGGTDTDGGGGSVTVGVV